jgi:hypothetical protein
MDEHVVMIIFLESLGQNIQPKSDALRLSVVHPGRI